MEGVLKRSRWRFTGRTFSHNMVLPEEDKVAPDEDTDMDLVADKLVLLSLPVKQRQFTAELDKMIPNCSFSFMLTSCQALCLLTFSLCMFFRVQFPFTLLALQLFLTTENISIKQVREIKAEHHLLGSDSPSPTAESPPSPSSGPANPSPASCETTKTQQTEDQWWNKTLDLILQFSPLCKNCLQALWGPVCLVPTLSETLWTQLVHHWLIFSKTHWAF